IAHGSATARVMADQIPAASQQLSRYASTGRAADCHDETIAAPAARTTPAMSIHHQGMPVTDATAVADQAVDAAMPAPMIGCLPGPNDQSDQSTLGATGHPRVVGPQVPHSVAGVFKGVQFVPMHCAGGGGDLLGSGCGG